MDDHHPDEEEGENRGGTAVNGRGGDRRMRLSMNTAIQFYDLQDRLGYDQPSKTVEWLLKAAAAFEIHHPFSLPPLPPPPLPTPPSTQDDSVPPPSSSQGDPPPTRTPSFDPSRSN